MGIKVKDLRFSYRDVEVLRGVDFEADKGSVIHILGRNGAGKTTMFRCILKLLRRYGGEIEVNGQNIGKLSHSELAGLIAYIPQSHTATFNYTVLDMVVMGTAAFVPCVLSPGKRQEDEALQALGALGIAHLANRGFANISGGERQLALIARALVQKARILIMDEPTANLDYTHQVHTMKTIGRLARQGYLVLLSTHNPEHTLLYADKVLVMKEGRVDRFGKPAHVITKRMMKDVYGLEVDFVQMPNSDIKSMVCLS